MIHYLVLREAPTHEYIQPPAAISDDYVTCIIPDKESGLEGSCSYKKKRKDSTLADSIHSNGISQQNSFRTTEGQEASSRY